MRSKIPAARLFIVFGFAAIFLAYVIYLISTINVMRSMRANSPHVITIANQTPQADFAMFWFSGRALMAHLFHGAAQSLPWRQPGFPQGIVASTARFNLSWLYPPPMGFLALGYATLPLAASFFVWRGVYFAFSSWLLRLPRLGWPAIVCGLASPAALHDLLGGENGALTGGIQMSSILLMDEQPWLAGVLAGLLCIKPQEGIGIGLLVLLTGRWRAMCGAIISGGSVCLLSLICFGPGSWVQFFTYSRRGAVSLVSQSFQHFFSPAGATTFFMARSFQADLTWAWRWQALSSFLGTILLCWIWRRPRPRREIRAALTLCLSALITPYGYTYDLVGYSIGMAAVFFYVPDERKPLYGFLWLFGGYSTTFANIIGHNFMPVALACGVALLWWEMARSAAPAMSAIPPHVDNPA